MAKEEIKEEEKQEEKAKKEEGKEKPKLSKEMEKILSSIESLSVLELSDLVKAMEEKFGVTAAAPVMVAGSAAAGPSAAPAEEKTMFDVILTKVGDKKIQVIKEIRTVTTLGLKEAKDLVESAPKPIKEGANKEEAEEIKKKLAAVGAEVELK